MTKSLNEILIEAYIDDNDEALQDLILIAQGNPHLVASNYYFCVVEGINYYSKQSEINITITPKVYFDKNGCLYDQCMEPVEIILGEDASEISSSSYTINYPYSLAQTENFLCSKGFTKDSTFEQFLNKTH